MKNEINDDNSENWQIVLVRKTYMKDIQFRQIRKQSAINNVLDKKNKIRYSIIFYDQANKLLSWLQTNFKNQNIAEFIFQNDILWVS